MGLLDEILTDGDQHRPGSTCWFMLLEQRDPELAAEVKDAIDQKVQFASLSRVLKSRGVKVTPSGVSRHSHKLCRCWE